MRNLAQYIASRSTSSHNAMMHIATGAVAVSIAVAVLVLAAGGVTAFLLLKKKNRK